MCLSSPSAMAVDAAGNTIIADSGKHRVQVFDATGRLVRMLGQPGTGRGELQNPQAVAVDRAENIIVLDSGNHRVQVFDMAGQVVRTLGRQGSGAGELQDPMGMAVDEAGNIVVADTGNNRVQVFGADAPPGEPEPVRPREHEEREAARILADAHADAERIVAEAVQMRTEAERIMEQAEVHRNEQAARIIADAHAAAERIVEEADQTRDEAERVMATAQVQARQPVGASRASVAILFQAELAAATDGFSNAHYIRSGGFGSVYQTSQLRELGTESSHFAIKKLDLASMQGEREFIQELQTLGACRHENLIPLLGISADRGASQREDGVCLVMPLMKGGSLEDRLSLDADARRCLALMPDAPEDGFAPLTWQQRLVVAVGILRGLEYLHSPDPTTYKPAIFHRDIKPSNILLDLQGHPRLADTGLAKELRPDVAHVTTVTRVAGTNGYIDEHYARTGQFDASADGFSMGVTLLVLLTCLPAVDAVHGLIRDRCDVDEEEVMSLVDASARWPPEVAFGVHRVALELAKPRSRRDPRISVSEARVRLQTLADAHLPAAPPMQEFVERECVICMSALRHVRFECGHSVFCRGCVGDFLQREVAPRCPHCGDPITQQGMVVGDNVAREDTFVPPRRR